VETLLFRLPSFHLLMEHSPALSVLGASAELGELDEGTDINPIVLVGAKADHWAAFGDWFFHLK
jgi:hypothetical protein